MDSCVYWLWLELVFGVGGRRLWEIADKDGDPEKLCEDICSGRAEGLNGNEQSKAKSISLQDARELIDRAAELGQKVVCLCDEDYPERLRTISDPPAVIFYRGDIALVKRKVLHFVGARQPSRYTASLIGLLCRETVARGFVLSSGFAEGSDRSVIEKTLECQGKALVMYPTSPENEYPKGCGELKEQLAENGLLMSEYPPGKKGMMDFKRRNRLAVALCSAVVITQASEDSKGLDNAVLAKELDRPLLVVPPHLSYTKDYFGQRDLLREGAVPLFDGEDIVRVLVQRGEIAEGSHALAAGVFRAEQKHTEAERKPTKTELAKQPTAERREEKAPSAVRSTALLDAYERVIVELLRERGAMTSDELIAGSGFDMIKLLPILVSLEMYDMIEVMPDKRYRLN